MLQSSSIRFFSAELCCSVLNISLFTPSLALITLPVHLPLTSRTLPACQAGSEREADKG